MVSAQKSIGYREKPVKSGRPMQETMLKYCKILLEKVSFDNRLLNKEYRKCIGYLNEEDKQQFLLWIACQDFSNRINGTEKRAEKENTGQ